MIPPKGFKSELYPLRHRFDYGVGLSLVQDAVNTTMCTLVKNYGAVVNPNTILVNPHNGGFEVETGAICSPMSIIDKMKLRMNFTLTEDAITDGVKSAVVQYLPIFTSFLEKLDSTDDKTTTTAKAILELTTNSTEEDVTPAFGTKLNLGASTGSTNHPVSTANFTEVFGTLNLTTNIACEGVPWSNEDFFNATRYYTNKGAIRSMVGRMRTVKLTDTFPTKFININKFVPRAVRRIVPYSFFAMLFHCPRGIDNETPYWSGAVTTAKPQIGIKMKVTYDEWNPEHEQDAMTG